MNSTEKLKLILNSMKIENNVTDERLEVKGFGKKKATVLGVMFALIGIVVIILALTISNPDKAAKIAIIIVGLLVFFAAFKLYKMADKKVVIDKIAQTISVGYGENLKEKIKISDIKNLHFESNGYVTNVYLKHGKLSKLFFVSYSNSNKQSDYVEQVNKAFFDWLDS